MAQKTQRQYRRSKPKTSRFRGVSVTPSGSYRVVAREGPKVRSLGTFANEEEAGLAYDRWAVAFIGPHALLNFPEKREELLQPQVTSWFVCSVCGFPTDLEATQLGTYHVGKCRNSECALFGRMVTLEVRS